MDAVHYFFVKFPWLETFLAWSIAICLVLAVFALPAYFYFLPLFRKISAETIHWLDGLRNRQKANREERQSRWNNAADSFRTDNLLKRIREGGRSIAAGVAARVKRQLKRLRQRVTDAVTSRSSLEKRTGELTESLKLFVFPANNSSPLPGFPQIVQETRSVGVASLELVVGMPLLLATLTANTVMLSQILRDLGIIPQSYASFGLPLVYFLALLLSLLESGLGVRHAILTAKHRGEDDEKLSLAPWAVLFLTLCLAVFEAMNYAGMAPDREQRVFLPFLGYGMPKQDIFFLLGLAIVWTLFGLGELCYRAGFRIIEGTAVGRLSRQLRKFQRRARECSTLMQNAESIAAKTQGILAQTDTHLIDPAAFDALRRELDRIDTSSSEANTAEGADLTRTEVMQLSQQAGFWIGAGMVAVTIMTLTGQESFSVLAPGMRIWLAWVLAVGQAIVFLAGGMLFASAETVAKGETGAVVEAPLWSRWLGGLLGGLLAVVYLWVLATSGAGIRLVWTCNFIFGVALFASGYRIQPLLGVATLFFRTIGNLLINTAEFFLRKFAEILHLVARILEYIAEFLASPVTFARRHKNAGNSSKAGSAAAA